MGGVGVKEGTFQSVCLEINFSSLLTKSPDLTNTVSSGLNFPQGVVGLQVQIYQDGSLPCLVYLRNLLCCYSNGQAQESSQNVACKLNTGDHLN